ncbi:MAG: hypothetical protein SPJ23_03565 [Eubacteriales bacterium]|nr:hypothetical protein [Eubacteriales bacterium]
MSVWGIGAFYDFDVSEKFISQGCACIGWNKADAPSLYQMLTSVKIGDIIYLKSFLPKKKQLIIKAVGIVIDNRIDGNIFETGNGIRVKWKALDTPIKVDITEKIYKNNVFNNTLYEEYNPEILEKVISEIFVTKSN